MRDAASGESGAIIQYLCERHGGESWLPDPSSDAHIDHLEWMQFGESSFFVPVMLKIYAGRLGEAAAPLSRIEERLVAHIDYAESRISMISTSSARIGRLPT